MFHQVFICDETQDPDSSRNLLLDQNNVNNAPQTIKQENLTSGDNTVGLVLAEDIKMAVGTLKSEKCSLLNNQTVMETDTEVTKMDLDAKDFLVPSLSSMVFPVSQTGQTFMLPVTTGPAIQPLQSTLISSPGQVILEQPQQAPGIQPLGPTYVFQTSVENALQPQPTLIKMSGNIIQLAAPPAPLLTGALAVSSSPVINTDFLQQSTQDIQNLPTVSQKTEPLSSLINVVGEGLKREKTDLTSNQTTIKKKEQPMEDDLHAGLSDSGDNDTQDVGNGLQGNIETTDLNISHKLVINKREMFPSLEEIKESRAKVQEPVKSHENVSIKIINRREHELRKLHDIKECIVVINNSSEYITPELIPDHRIENTGETSLSNDSDVEDNVSIDDSSDSDVGDNVSIDDSSGSDWEQEHLGKHLEDKRKLINKKCQKSSDKNTNSIVPSRMISTQCNQRTSGTFKVGDYGSKNVNASKAINKINPNVTTPSGNLPVNRGHGLPTSMGGNVKTLSLSNKASVSNSNNIILSPGLNTLQLVAKPTQLHSVNNTCQIQLPLQASTQKTTFLCVPQVICGKVIDHQKNSSQNNEKQTLVFTKPTNNKNEDKIGGGTNAQSFVGSSQFKNTTSSHAVQEISEKDNELPFRKILPKPCFSNSYTFGIVKAPPSNKCSFKESVPNNSSKDERTHPAKEPEVRQYLYLCKECDKYFKDLQQYIYHKQASMCFEKIPEVKYECDVCGKCLSNSENLQNHKNLHTNARPFKCPKCDDRFNSKKARHKHYKTQHCGQKAVDSRYVCSFCGYRCSKLMYLKAHEEEHGLPDGAEIPKPFMCEECGMCFRYPGNLRNHRKFHAAASFFCDICDKGFKNKGNLKQHMITHSDGRPISCHLCGDKFKRATHLKQHISARHGEEVT